MKRRHVLLVAPEKRWFRLRWRWWCSCGDHGRLRESEDEATRTGREHQATAKSERLAH